MRITTDSDSERKQYLKRMFAAIPQNEHEQEKMALTMMCRYCHAAIQAPCRDAIRFRRAHKARVADWYTAAKVAIFREMMRE